MASACAPITRRPAAKINPPATATSSARDAAECRVATRGAPSESESRYEETRVVSFDARVMSLDGRAPSASLAALRAPRSSIAPPTPSSPKGVVAWRASSARSRSSRCHADATCPSASDRTVARRNDWNPYSGLTSASMATRFPSSSAASSRNANAARNKIITNASTRDHFPSASRALNASPLSVSTRAASNPNRGPAPGFATQAMSMRNSLR